MKNKRKFFSVLLGILLALNLTAAAQNAVKQWRVIVSDAQNQAVAGAKCILSQDKKTIAEIQTDADGAAIFTGVPDGVYHAENRKGRFWRI